MLSSAKHNRPWSAAAAVCRPGDTGAQSAARSALPDPPRRVPKHLFLNISSVAGKCGRHGGGGKGVFTVVSDRSVTLTVGAVGAAAAAAPDDGGDGGVGGGGGFFRWSAGQSRCRRPAVSLPPQPARRLGRPTPTTSVTCPSDLPLFPRDLPPTHSAPAGPGANRERP